MVARAIWKGYLEIGELVCPVALNAAASKHWQPGEARLRRRETDEPVDTDDQVKGYKTDGGRAVVLEPEEIAAAVPDSDKMLHVQAFISCADVDTLYLDRPYYLRPAEASAETAFAVIRDGMAKRKVAAVARSVLFRRVRSVLIRPVGDGLVAHTLEYEHEVRSAAQAFKGMTSPKIDKEMLELAKHIIKTKRGKFDASKFEDRYNDALAALVKAKAAGEPLPTPKEPTSTEPVDLMQALRDSAKSGGRRGEPATPRKNQTPVKRASPRRKAS